MLDVEGIDRMYLNAYQPLLQTEGGVRFFFWRRGMKVVGTSLMAPYSHGFVAVIRRFVSQHRIPLHHFQRNEKKELVALKYRQQFKAREGVVFVGVAQEKFWTFRTRRQYNPQTGKSYPVLYRTTVFCNQYYFYILDEDFGPMFIKFASYFPFTGRICINGHEYAKRQLEKEKIAYQPLDNGFESCTDPRRLQEILKSLNEVKIEALFGKWQARLPQPFSQSEQAAGYNYNLSILQLELARTQVFDQPLAGRHFFEEVIRENIDLGRPENVALIFERRVTRRTPGSFRTRVITEGVIPSLLLSYKHSKIKQYFKAGRALRTETTINNTRDFGIGRKLRNLPALRELGFKANRKLLEVERVSHDCRIGEERFQKVTQPVVVGSQRGAALRYGDPRVMALLSALCLFGHLPQGFRNGDLRGKVAELMGREPESYGAGRMTYDLRRLRLHGLIARKPKSHCYEVTAEGLRMAWMLSKMYARLLRPACSEPTGSQHGEIGKALRAVNKAISLLIAAAKIDAAA